METTGRMALWYFKEPVVKRCRTVFLLERLHGKGEQGQMDVGWD